MQLQKWNSFRGISLTILLFSQALIGCGRDLPGLQTFSTSHQSTTTARNTVPNQLIIKFKRSPNKQKLNQFASRHGLRIIKLSALGAVLIENKSEKTTQDLMNQLSNEPEIDYVEPNRVYRSQLSLRKKNSRNRRKR